MLLLLDAVGLPTRPGVAVGLWRDGHVIHEFCEEVARGAAERLFPLIDLALRAAPRHEIAAVATATGPGGFAACRAGVAAARGLALGLRVPALGVSWLEAVAFGRAGATRVALPAGRGLSAVQRFQDGAPLAPPEPGEAAPDDLGAAALTGSGLAALGGCAAAKLAQGVCDRPGPLYLRPPDAAKAPPPPSLIV